ncbi:MAG: DUF167 family protein [bacterium]|nr:DUF167 family protein [bacterium]
MYIKVEVIARAKEEYVRKTGPDSFVISVREKAEQNSANRRVLELMRLEFGGRGVQIKIISGHHSPRKILSVEKKNPPRVGGI